MAQGLRLRQRLEPLFTSGEYRPLAVRGQRQRNAIAFERRSGDTAVIAVATLQPGGLLSTDSSVGERWEPDWGDTFVEAIEEPGTQYINALDGAVLETTANRLPLDRVLGTLPVALLERRRNRAT
jgi:(1->4)-alpha-D-glucan 1-alpha-D-glucosylmutase